jgi:hypothetical protein
MFVSGTQPERKSFSSRGWLGPEPVGVRFIFNASEPGNCPFFVYAKVIELDEDTDYVVCTCHSESCPKGEKARVARALALYPITYERFCLCAQLGFPADPMRVRIVSGFVNGGKA